MRTLRVLVLTYDTHVPPAHTKGIDLQRVDWKLEHDLLRALRAMGQEVLVLGVGSELTPIQNAVDKWAPNIVFNLLDEFAGTSGLDQNVASYLELLGVPYTGCNPRGLILARDKALTKKILTYHGVSVPEFWVFPRGRRVSRSLDVRFPVIVKSLTEEASLGISQASVVHDATKLRNRIAFIHATVGSDAIVEQYIDGRELYVGVIGNSRLEAFPVWELRWRRKQLLHRIATRRVKWNPDYRRRHQITTGQARGIPVPKLRQLQDLCKQAYRNLGLSGYARMDLRLDGNGEPFILEANPNPHIARGEEMAESARRAGISYEEFLWRILTLGLAWEPGRIVAA